MYQVSSCHTYWAACLVALAACSTTDSGTGPGAEPAASVAVSPSVDTLTALGESQSLSAVARGADGAIIQDLSFTWASSNPGVATVSTDGSVTAKSGGITTISASTGGVTGSAAIVVDQKLANLSVTPVSWQPTALGATQQMLVVATDANNHPIPGLVAIWSASDTSVVTISPTGLATSLTTGTATITSSLQDRDGTAAVTVTQKVNTLAINPGDWNPMALGAQQQLTAVATDANSNPVADWDLQWSSSDTTIALIDANGLATATGPGSATISANTPGVAETISVLVAQSIDSVRVTPPSDTLRPIGTSKQAQATALDPNGRPVEGVTFSWSSSDSAVASVASDGTITAVAQGNALITASAGSRSATVTIVILASAPPPIVSLRAVPEIWTATTAGQKQEFAVIATDANGDEWPYTGAVVWTSSNPSVASVDAAGLVTATQAGSTTLTAASGGLQGTAAITVDPTGAIANGVVWSVYFARQIESPAILTGGVLRTPGYTYDWSVPYEFGSVTKFQWEGDRIGILTNVTGGLGTLRVRDRVGEWVDLVLGSARDFQLEGNRIGVVGAGGSLIVKEGISGGWTTLANSGVTKFQLEGDRIGELLTDGTFRVKDGVNGAWTVLGSANTADFLLGGNRIGMVTKAGVFRVKDGINGGWTTLANSGVAKFQLEGNRIGELLSGGTFRVKDGIHGVWTTLGSSGIVDFQLQGSRIGMVSNSGEVRVKTGTPQAPWTFSHTYPGVTQFQAAVAAPVPPDRTTPASYALGQAGCITECTRHAYIPIQWGTFPVPFYGRTCGAGRPADGASTETIDGMDQACWHHDHATTWYATSTGSLSNDYSGACIVRYAMLNAKMSRDGVVLTPGTAAWNQAWGLMPEMYEARRRYLNWTSSCTPFFMSRFANDTRLEL